MRTSLLRAIGPILLVAASGFGTAAPANPIERACMQSDRPGASRELCGCVGAAAELTLSPSDMRTGARFFRDPGRAQEVQLSDTARNDAFWSRWQRFGETAEALCG